MKCACWELIQIGDLLHRDQGSLTTRPRPRYLSLLFFQASVKIVSGTVLWSNIFRKYFGISGSQLPWVKLIKYAVRRMLIFQKDYFVQICQCENYWNMMAVCKRLLVVCFFLKLLSARGRTKICIRIILTLLHSERQKLYRVFAVLSATGINRPITNI